MKYPNFEIEKSLYHKYSSICGVDEAGRGPIAGPVVAAAVILPRDFEDTFGINDSKKISEKKRFELAQVIKETAISWAVSYSNVEEIEEKNILHASVGAMRNAIENLTVKADYALIDGNYFPFDFIDFQTIVGGDAKSWSIAAASIIAKTERDSYMIRISEQYSEYGFEKHKGYGTKKHYQAIDEFGVTPIHRPTFLRKYFDRKKQGTLF